MSLFLWVAVCFLVPPVRVVLISVVLWFIGGKEGEKRNDEGGERNNERLAEVAGAAWQTMSVFEHIEQGLEKNPDAPAVICTFQSPNHFDVLLSGPDHRQTQAKQQPNRHLRGSTNGRTCLTLTYGQLHGLALKLASGLLEHGVQPGKRMVMLIPNGGEYALLLWTCVLLRVTYVSLDPALLDITGFTQLKQLLKLLKPQLVVAPDALAGKALDVAVSELQLPQPVRVCLTSASDGSQGRQYELVHNWHSLASIMATSDAPIDEAALVAAARRDDPDRLHSIMFTSGTSGGAPKGCPMRAGGMSHVLHSQAWLVDAGAGAVALQQPHNSRGIAPAQTLQTWKAGGAVVMTGQSFDVREAVGAIRHLGATFVVLTPPMVHEMAAELGSFGGTGANGYYAPPGHLGDDALASVRRVQVGGDTVTRDLLRKCAALFPRAEVCINHGMTEGGGSFVWPFLRVPVTQVPLFGEIAPIGAVAPGSTVRIWDAERQRVAARGEPGELHISCASIIRGYLGGRSREPFYRDSNGKRWFNTGDVAVVDYNGFIFILGRTKDVIRRAGVALMPAALESSIEAFVGVPATVVAIPHYALGDEPFAVLGSLKGKTETQVKSHVRAVFGKDCALGGLASLDQLGLVEFPLNPTRKIMKSEVRKAVIKYLATRNV
ncbi:putative amp dependent CoA ligase [Chaetomium sp. MPI-CAGE-AT-0009]|nr:putative amp dependent CoA ligase [Chaetomium sp. MPI-CAGE-AT-0009]